MMSMGYCRTRRCHALQPLDKNGRCQWCAAWKASGKKIPKRPSYDWFDNNRNATPFLTQWQYDAIQRDRDRKLAKAQHDFFYGKTEAVRADGERRIFIYRHWPSS